MEVLIVMNQKEQLNLSRICRKHFTVRKTGDLSQLFFDNCDMNTTSVEFMYMYFEKVPESKNFENIFTAFIKEAVLEGYSEKEAENHLKILLFSKAMNGFKKELAVMEKYNCLKMQELERYSIDLYQPDTNFYIQVKSSNYYKYRSHPSNVKMFEQERMKQNLQGYDMVLYIYVNDNFEIEEVGDYKLLLNYLNNKKRAE